MKPLEVVRDIQRIILLMSVIATVVSLFLFAIKPLIKDRISKAAYYYLWVFVLAILFVPFSAFVSIPIDTPITSIKEVIDDNIKTWEEEFEEAALIRSGTFYTVRQFRGPSWDPNRYEPFYRT